MLASESKSKPMINQELTTTTKVHNELILALLALLISNFFLTENVMNVESKNYEIGTLYLVCLWYCIKT